MTSALAPFFCVFGMHSLFLPPRYTHLNFRDTLTFHIVWITAMEKRRDILARIPRALAAESGKPVTGLLAVGKGTSYIGTLFLPTEIFIIYKFNITILNKFPEDCYYYLIVSIVIRSKFINIIFNKL